MRQEFKILKTAGQQGFSMQTDFSRYIDSGQMTYMHIMVGHLCEQIDTTFTTPE